MVSKSLAVAAAGDARATHIKKTKLRMMPLPLSKAMHETQTETTPRMHLYTVTVIGGAHARHQRTDDPAPSPSRLRRAVSLPCAAHCPRDPRQRSHRCGRPRVAPSAALRHRAFA